MTWDKRQIKPFCPNEVHSLVGEIITWWWEGRWTMTQIL